MKMATGQYFNLFSEEGYHNCNLKLKFDIMIIFIESFNLTSDVIESLELMLEGRLNDVGLNHPLAKKEEVKEVVEKVLDTLEYEYERVIVDQRIR